MIISFVRFSLGLDGVNANPTDVLMCAEWNHSRE